MKDDPVRDVEHFVHGRGQRPLWVAAWCVFVAAAGFAANTLLGIPQENALIAQDRAVAITNAQTEKKLDAVTRMLTLMVDAALTAARAFETQIEQSADLGKVDRAVATEVLRLIRESRGGNDALLSVFDSLQTRDADADSLVAKFRDDIRALDDTLVPREQTLAAILGGNTGQALDLITNVRDDPEGRIRRQLVSFSLRTEEFAQLVRGKKEAFATDLEARRVRRTQYEYKVYLAIAAIGYMSALATFAYSSWKRERKRRYGNPEHERTQSAGEKDA